MKEILLFVMKGCPHCARALKLQEELLAEHPQWQEIPLRVVDERQEKALADAYDYYYFDETGTPRFLASCANEVLEADFNSDGVAELLWFSHGYMAIYCFQLDGAVYEVDLNRLIQEARPQWEEIMAPATGIELASDPLLPFSYVEGGVPHTGTITFLPDAIRVDLS